MKKYLIVIVIITGCYIPNEKPKVKVFTQVDTLIVIDKKVVHSEATFLSSSYDKNYVAFSNGDLERFNFGEYSLLNIGDTITRSKLNTEWSWKYKLN